MYRYSQKKTEAANQKLRQKQKRQKQERQKQKQQVTVGKRRVVTAKAAAVTPKTKTISAVKMREKKSSKKQLLPQKKSARVSESVWWKKLKQLLTWIVSAVIVTGLLVASYLIVMDTILPHFFRIERMRTILLVGSTEDQQAKRVYLVRMVPASRTVQVTDLNWKMLVPVVGGQDHGANPLGSVAPILHNYDHAQEQWIKAAYIFALGQMIDEVDFIPDLPEVTTQADLQKVLWSRWQSQLMGGSAAREEWLNEYFQVRTSQYFRLEKAEAREDVQASNQVMDRQKLVNCPVVLINAAAVNGLARAFERLVDGYGAAVINLSTAAETESRSQIYYNEKQPDCLQLVQIATQTLPLTPELIPDGGIRALQDRGQAVIVLGKELSD
ncbi:hypothetical protein IJJ27_03460 [bacterium]|nr:hypothetical protein [bacterium]